jgi:molybdate transport repressor ModE-like protein
MRAPSISLCLMLDLRRIQILCAVARGGSLAAAAKELSYSTPAVWQHMKRLEAEVGHTLLLTHPRGVRLTHAGEVLARHGEEMLRQARMAQAELADLRGLATGRLRVAAFATAAAGLLPTSIARFRATHPAVQIALTEDEPAAALRRMRDGELDLALVYAYGDAPTDDERIAFTHLLDDPLHVALPAGHRLAEAPTLALADLRGEPLLEGRHNAAVLRGDEHDASPPRVDLTYRGGDFLTVQQLVAAGAGVALIPRLALQEIAGVVIKPLVDEAAACRRVFAVTHRRPHRQAASESFLALVREQAGLVEASWEAPGLAA